MTEVGGGEGASGEEIYGLCLEEVKEYNKGVKCQKTWKSSLRRGEKWIPYLKYQKVITRKKYCEGLT